MKQYKNPKMRWKDIEKYKRSIFISRLQKIFNVPAHQLIKLLSTDRKYVLRINDLKDIPYQSILDILQKDGYILTKLNDHYLTYQILSEPKELYKSDLFTNGYIYLQNLSSLLPIEVMNPNENDDILDACSAPGGKIQYLSQLLKNNANIYINDSDSIRYKNLLENLKLYNVKYKEAFNLDIRNIDRTKMLFDKILLDIRCSGEARINLNYRYSMRFWSIDKIKKISEFQKESIIKCFDQLKIGGSMVYSTCTYSPEENEEVIDHLIKNRSNSDITKIKLNDIDTIDPVLKWENKIFNEKINNCIRIFPNKLYESFFICKIIKN